jgi:hypothetical protein
MSYLSSVQDFTVNNEFSVGGNSSMNTVTANSINCDNINAESLTVNGDNFQNYLQVVNDDLNQMSLAIADTNTVKADITYVDTALNQLLNADNGILQTIQTINTVLQDDGNNINSLLTSVALKANDANTVHKDSSEIITGLKQFNGGVTLNSNVIADNVTVIPQKIGYIGNLTSDCQAQLNSGLTNTANLQPEHNVVTSSTTWGSSHRPNAQVFLNPTSAITFTLPSITNQSGKFCYIKNISAFTCTIAGNGSNIYMESTPNVFTSTSSVSILPNESMILLFSTNGYHIIHNSSLIAKLQALITALQNKTPLLSSNGTNFLVTKYSQGPDNGATFIVKDSDTTRSLSVFPNIASKTYTSLVEQSDTLLLASNILTIAPNTTSSKALGIRMTQDDLILSSSTSAVSDNKIVMNATNKTIYFTSPNWIGFSQAVSCPDVILNTYSLTQTLANIITNAQMMSYDSSDQSTVLSKSGLTNRPTLKIIDNLGKGLYFLPTASNDAYNYLVDASDSVIAYSDALAIVPYINDNTGIRMTKLSVELGSTSSQPESGMDNSIYFNGTNRTIEMKSPNWIASNQPLIAPDYYLSGTNASVSGSISVLNGQYTSAFNGLSTHTDAIGVLQTKTQKMTCDGTETHFSSNVVVDSASVSINRTDNTPVLYNNARSLYVVKAMVSFCMSSSGPQIMTGGSSPGCTISKNSTGVYFLTLPLVIRQTLTTFSATNLTFYSCSAQINIGDSSLLSGWTAKTSGDAGNGIIAIFLRGGGSNPSLSDLPNFASNLRTYITVFCY